MNRELEKKIFTSLQFDIPNPSDRKARPLGSHDYYKNPTFEIELTSPLNETVFTNLKLIAADSRDIINTQLFIDHDMSFKKPILYDINYEQGQYTKLNVPLMTNQKYTVVTSSYNAVISNNFNLVVGTSNSNENVNIRMQRIYKEYGGLPYQETIHKSWNEDSNRVKIHLDIVPNNLCFIRIVPIIQSPLLRVRCNVFDEETGEILHKQETFEPVSLGGIAIDNLQITTSTLVVLIIEKDDTAVNGKIVEVPFQLLIGSQKKIIYRQTDHIR